MQDMGIQVLFEGINLQRLLAGLWVSLRLALISMAFSVILGILLGMVMAGKNKLIGFLCRTLCRLLRL